MEEIEENLPISSKSSINETEEVKQKQIDIFGDIIELSLLSTQDRQAILKLFEVPRLEKPNNIPLQNNNSQLLFASELLDKWIEKISEIKSKRKTAQKDRSSKIKSNIKASEKLRNKLIDSVLSYMIYLKDHPKQMEISLLADFVIASEFISKSSKDINDENPIQAVANHFIHFHPVDYFDVIVVTINFLAVPIFYRTTAELVSEAKSQKQVPKDLRFAYKFAKNILKQIKIKRPFIFLRAILYHKLEKKDLSEDFFLQMATLANLIMLALALTVIYKVQTGWISGEEFAAMLKGDMKLKENSIEEKVVKAMLEQLEHLTRVKRAEAIDSLMGYFDKNPSIQTIINPKKVVDSGVFNQIIRPSERA